MGQRLDLQSQLESLLGSRNVYFQPKSNLKMSYPCIVYKQDFAKTESANNKPYVYTRRYEITLIHRDPDTPLNDQIAHLSKCTFNRHYEADDLHHFNYNIYF